MRPFFFSIASALLLLSSTLLPGCTNKPKGASSDLDTLDFSMFDATLRYLLVFDVDDIADSYWKANDYYRTIGHDTLDEKTIRDYSMQMVNTSDSLYRLSVAAISDRDYVDLHNIIYDNYAQFFSSPRITIEDGFSLCGMFMHLASNFCGEDSVAFAKEMTDLLELQFVRTYMVETIDADSKYVHPDFVATSILLMDLYLQQNRVEEAEEVGMRTLGLLKELNYQGEDARDFVYKLAEVMNLKDTK